MSALFIGIIIGFVLAGLLMNANKTDYESEIYQQGYEDGINAKCPEE